MTRVLVVEDDFRVAEVHVAFAARVPGVRVVGTAGTLADARAKIAALRPELVLLDVYLPDGSGLELLDVAGVDTILLTAASDAATVRTALSRGALGYLVKPFTAEQLEERLGGYLRYRSALGSPGARELRQEDIDRALRSLRSSDRSAPPKGQSAATARLVADALRGRRGEARTAAEVAVELGIARVTAQRYLAALAQSGEASMRLRYGTTGRPEHLYEWLGP